MCREFGGTQAVWYNGCIRDGVICEMRVGPFGMTELLLILVVVLLIFGASRLPGVGSALGKGIRSFKSSVTGEDEQPTRDASADERSPSEPRS